MSAGDAGGQDAAFSSLLAGLQQAMTTAAVAAQPTAQEGSKMVPVPPVHTAASASAWRMVQRRAVALVLMALT